MWFRSLGTSTSHWQNYTDKAAHFEKANYFFPLSHKKKKRSLSHTQAPKSTAERQFSSIYLHTVPLRHALLHPLMNTYRLTHTTNRVGLMNDRVLCLLGTFKLVNIIGLYCISVSLEQKPQTQYDFRALTKNSAQVLGSCVFQKFHFKQSSNTVYVSVSISL